MLGLFVLPAAGAAGFVVVLETAGGDFGRWSRGAATDLLLAAFAGPAALSRASARALGRCEALALAACTLLMELALVFGVAFVGLGYGPH